MNDAHEASFTAADVDTIVGERIRRRRILTGLTQDQLGEALGVSYQQIQKYETGANRISAGRLYLLAQTLGVAPGWFFDGLSDQPTESSELPSSRLAIECVRNLSRLKDEKVRSALLTMMRTLADAEDDYSEPVKGVDSDSRGNHEPRPLAD